MAVFQNLQNTSSGPMDKKSEVLMMEETGLSPAGFPTCGFPHAEQQSVFSAP